MTPEIRRMAVRMAAKAAFVASIAGCSSSPQPSTTTTTQAAGSDVKNAAPAQPVSCVDHIASLKHAKTVDDLPEGDPLRGKPGVYAAFADPAERNAPRTLECCKEGLEAEGGSTMGSRFECCSALGSQPGGTEPAACTPWGPPCPPEMFA